MRPRLAGVWANPNFRKLWLGQTISGLGSQVTLLALPLTAVVLLGAGPQETGFLTAAAYLPMLLFGLVAGVWIDRFRRQPILIACDLSRAVLIATVPVAAAAGILRLEHLYAVAFLSGTVASIAGLASVAFVPTVAGRQHLLEANSATQGSASVAQIVGPAAAGAIVQLLTAPIAVAIDAVSFVVSAASTALVRVAETARSPEARPSPGADLVEGLRWVGRNEFILPLVTGAAVINWGVAAGQALFIVYATRDLGLSPAALGLVLAAAGPASLAGALFATRLARRFGMGPTILGALLVEAAGRCLVPVTYLVPPLAIPLLLGAQATTAFSGSTFNINSITFRQTVTPDRLQGRVNAAARTVALSTTPLGALMGGWLAERFGIPITLLVAALAIFLGFARLWLSPVRTLRRV